MNIRRTLVVLSEPHVIYRLLEWVVQGGPRRSKMMCKKLTESDHHKRKLSAVTKEGHLEIRCEIWSCLLSCVSKNMIAILIRP